MIKIYNSLTSQIEEFVPLKPGEVTMYVCGPTVYNHSHIGNSRPVVFFDVVSRFFNYLGYKVKYVSNFTDIDDKIIARAKEENISEEEVSEKYIEAFLQLRKQLNCLPHYKNPRVTENINQIIDFIDVLIKKDGAYISDGDVYFKVDKINEYGVLSGQSLDNLIHNLETNTHIDKKQNPLDFVLWKKTTEGRRWQSPWSEGRPGWHTECVVMINEIFGGKIDIHGGGVDLKFPHHDNEIAQSICAHNHKIANYWMHNGRMDYSGEKMSKSLGNVVWTKDILKDYPYQAFRLLILNTPYRQPLNFTFDLLKQSTAEYEKISRAYIGLFRKLELTYGIRDFETDITFPDLQMLKDEFIKEMSNDFNTPNALTVIQKIVKLANTLTRNNDNVSYMLETLKLFKELLGVLGTEVEVDFLTLEERTIVERWQNLRKNKQFEEADRLRKEIIKRGIII